MTTVRYDDSFDTMAAVVDQTLGSDELTNGLILREAGGRLSFVYGGSLSPEKRSTLESALRAALGAYAREDRVLATRDDVGSADLLAESAPQWLNVRDRRIRYLDRRIVGMDWLASPHRARKSSPQRFVFASLKGGVGRTTALCVAAADLAREGTNVLVVDLDLEAPGVGSTLLPADTDQQPKFGTIDYLAEATVSDSASGLVPELVRPSILTQSTGGRVDVVPAFGSGSRPEHYLGKLSRAMLDQAPDGSPRPLRKKLATLVGDLAQQATYDIVLIDARAGLAELTAGPLLELSADVFLFGTAQQQTVDGCRLLFSHLASLVPPECPSPWTDISMVLAKATADTDRTRWFLEAMHTLFQDYLYEEQEGLSGFNFDVEDRSAPHYPVPIGMNPVFADWDPSRRASDLTQPMYEATFRPFLERLRQRITRQ